LIVLGAGQVRGDRGLHGIVAAFTFFRTLRIFIGRLSLGIAPRVRYKLSTYDHVPGWAAL
jgi:hypothetical protein